MDNNKMKKEELKSQKSKEYLQWWADHKKGAMSFFQKW